MTEPFLLHHDPQQPAGRVTNAGELAELLLRITATALDEEAPTFAVLVTPDERRRLDIGLGEPEYSVLIHHDEVADSVHASKGLPVPYDAGFDYAGNWSPAPADSAIPIADARDAAREFVETGGGLPSGVRWQNPRYES